MGPAVLAFLVIAIIFVVIGSRAQRGNHSAAAAFCWFCSGIFGALTIVAAYMVLLEMNPSTFGS